VPSVTGAGALAVLDATIYSFFLSHIVRLPFDSISTKVGVSRHIDTNGGRAPRSDLSEQKVNECLLCS
jgi:hypothetical protein